MSELSEKMNQMGFNNFALIGVADPTPPLDLSALVSLDVMEKDVLEAERRGSSFAETLRRIFERRRALNAHRG